MRHKTNESDVDYKHKNVLWILNLINYWLTPDIVNKIEKTYIAPFVASASKNRYAFCTVYHNAPLLFWKCLSWTAKMMRNRIFVWIMVSFEMALSTQSIGKYMCVYILSYCAAIQKSKFKATTLVTTCIFKKWLCLLWRHGLYLSHVIPKTYGNNLNS